MDSVEKIVSMGEDAVILDFSVENATSILCQAMFDETIRLRRCHGRRERNLIRKFLIDSAQIIFASAPSKSSPKVTRDDKQQ